MVHSRIRVSMRPADSLAGNLSGIACSSGRLAVSMRPADSLAGNVPSSI